MTGASDWFSTSTKPNPESAKGRIPVVPEPESDPSQTQGSASELLKETEPVPRVFVIIPTLNESARVAGFASLGAPVIVADGGSADGTGDLARAAGLRVVESEPGRGVQMNAGAAAAMAAGANVLLFLHADTTLPADWQRRVAATLARPGTVAGAFRFALDAPGRRYRWLEKLVRVRRTPYGDQAIFLTSAVFRNIGGFPDWPLLEDVELVRRAKKLGRVRLADAAAVTSARRWRERGILQTTLLNQRCLWAFRLGVDPARIARWRRGETH